jgi:hypothetical protein
MIDGGRKARVGDSHLAHAAADLVRHPEILGAKKESELSYG